MPCPQSKKTPVRVSTARCHAPFFGRQTLAKRCRSPHPQSADGPNRHAADGPNRHDKNRLRLPPSIPHHQSIASGSLATGQTPAIYGDQPRNGRRINGSPNRQPPLPSIHALLRRFPSGPVPVQKGKNPSAALKRPSTPFERDKSSLADSDTTMRPMRQPAALENPSPATILPSSSHPFALLFRHSPDTKLPLIRQNFPSWFRYDHETDETTFSYKNLCHSYDVCLTSYEHAPSPPVFTATKSTPMVPNFRSCLRYNHETNQTTTTPNRPQWPAACILDRSHQHLRYL